MDNDLDRRLLLGVAGLAGVAALAKLSHAGPLAPPAGAVAATGKTLTEIEPRTAVGPTTTPGDSTATYIISQPGSYYLTGNLAGQIDKGGIKITASGVFLDLMGFSVRGVAGGTQFRSGVEVSVGTRDVCVTNGAVSNWRSTGVVMQCTNGMVRGVCCSGNAAGIVLIDGAAAVDCSCSFNGNGFSGGTGSAVLTRCTANQNTLGFNSGGVHTECTASANTEGGFQAYGVFRGCTSRNNTGNGINTIGTSLVVECFATQNTVFGIVAQQGSLVRDCVCSANGSHGIYGGGQCIIHGNVCTGNTGHGIMMAGGSSRLEMNHCAGNQNGVDMSGGTHNIALHNTVTGNSNFGYNQGTGNLFGPNLTAQATMNTGTNPHNNYEP